MHRKKFYILVSLIFLTIYCHCQENTSKSNRHSLGINTGLNYCYSYSSQENDIEPEIAYSYSLSYYYNFNNEISLKSGLGNSILKHNNSSKFSNNKFYTTYWTYKYYYLPIEINYSKNNFIYYAGIKFYLLHAYSIQLDRYLIEVDNAIKELPIDQNFEYGINAGLKYSIKLNENLNLLINIMEVSFFSIPLVSDKKRFLVMETGIGFKIF